MSIPSHVKYIVMSLLFILAGVNFTRTTLEIMHSSKRLEELRSEVSVLEEEKNTLEDELSYRETSSYLEEQARDRLNMIKPGDKVFIRPTVLSGSDVRAISELESSEKSSEAREMSSNIELWLNLLF
ncbi:MAG: FtsB family cell division protein [Patescibacteria group bacterium]